MNLIKDKDKIIEALDKSGFSLEYKVSNILENSNWNVINSRYYIDDLKGIDREIDILAYKVYSNTRFNIYTTLIISCKKSEEKNWCFFTKKMKENDPNINKIPFNNWSNNNIINFMLDKENFLDVYLENKENENWMSELFNYNRQIFAFQEIKGNEGASIKIDNDKHIYDSIMTTIKALEFERSNLGKRKVNDEKINIYNFNLVSIFQGKLMFERYFLPNETSELNELKSINYINRHLVNAQENFYRVTFSNFENFQSILKKYSKLHSFNSKYFQELENRYYTNCLENREYFEFIKKDVQEKLKKWMIFYTEVELENISYNSEKIVLEISYEGFDSKGEIIKKLNQNEKLVLKIKEVLYEYYKFNGEISIEDYFPF